MENFKLPMQRHEGEFALDAASTDGERVPVKWYTGAIVPRFSFFDGMYELQLSMEPAHVRMTRMNNGSTPLLDSHDNTRVSSVLGVLENGRIEGGIGTANIRFSPRAEAQAVKQDIQAGIIRNASVGSLIYKLKDITPEDSKTKRFLAIDWEPVEVSAVPVGADPAAGFSQDQQRFSLCEVETGTAELRATAPIGDPTMDPTQTVQPGTVPPVNPATAAPSDDQIRLASELAAKNAIAAERLRVHEINKAVSAAKLGAEFSIALVNEGLTIDQARERILAELAKPTHDNPTRTQGANAEVTRAQEETRFKGVVSALMHRSNPTAFKLEDCGREYMGMSLLRIAEEFVASRGQSVRGLSRDALAQLALESGGRQANFGGYEGTTDLPAVLADVANKSLRQSYEMTPRTFLSVFRMVTAVDFKNRNVVLLGEAPKLEKVMASGEIKTGAVSDSKETYALATYGKIVGLNRQTIVNDDLDAFSRVPASMGMQAANLESDTVWGIVTANAALGQDSVALFHATHKNVVSSGGGVPSVPQVSSLRKLLRAQTGLDGKTLLNIMGKYLIVPAALETDGEQLIQATPLVPVTVGTTVPQWFRSLNLVVEPRLDANSAALYYLVADYNQIDTIEYAYLEGQQGVFIETRMGFNVDGIEIKARLDFAAKAIDFRGMARNVGA